MSKKYLITSALPYANGPLHFGHLTGVYIPADIFTRHLRLQGKEVLHISGSDEHGVAIMIGAEKEKKSYAEYVDGWHEAHKKLFDQYQVSFDFFGRTSAPYHRVETLDWFERLNAAGFITKKTEKQLYSIDDGKFLPDRYVEGECYNCQYPHARGDECPNCGEWIDPIRLKNPVSKMSGSRNIEVRDAEQYYLALTKLQEQLKAWVQTKSHWRPVVRGFVDALIKEGLVDRAITRDLAWGIDVPLPEAKGKKFYVWFDAPIGYVSNTKAYLEANPQLNQDYLKDWWNNSDTEIVHFIGKDNIIFHSLIFPGMIIGSGKVKLPTEIPANQFLNLMGKQFSKSTGWTIDAEAAASDFGVDAMRMYLCSLIPERGDSSFSWEGFTSVYEEVANKVGNFVHRYLSFVDKYFPQGLSGGAFIKAREYPELKKITEKSNEILRLLDQCEFTKAFDELLKLAQISNETFHERAPWKAIKTDASEAEATLAWAVLAHATLAMRFEPFVPGLAAKLKATFGTLLSDSDWKKLYSSEASSLVGVFSRGFKRQNELHVLLPKIEPERLAPWKQQLTEK